MVAVEREDNLLQSEQHSLDLLLTRQQRFRRIACGIVAPQLRRARAACDESVALLEHAEHALEREVCACEARRIP